QMPLHVADIGDVQKSAEADVLLDPEAPIVDSGRGEIALNSDYGRRALAQRRCHEIRDGGVVRSRRCDQGRRNGELIHLVVREAVVEYPEAGADRGLAIAENVPGQADARSDLDRRRVDNTLVIQLHALERRARGTAERSD